MKSQLLVTSVGLLALLAMPAGLAAQGQNAQLPRYTVTDLGPVDNPFSRATWLNNHGLVTGFDTAPDGTSHAVLWPKGQTTPKKIGTPGLGGPNSAGFSVNERGQAVGQAETSVANDEDFCGFNFYGFPSLTACLPFLWQNGMMTPLPTLGGANGFANSINNRGEVAGLAETTITEAGCPVFQFEPVIWKHGVIRELLTYPGDTDGVAAAINDNGQVSGASGRCASSLNGNSGLYLVENHAMLWESDGTPHDLGNLGGTGGIAGNHACALNNRGQVVGHSELANDTTFHGFLWTRHTGMQDLGTLPGNFDYASLALGINDGGDVVGASLDATFSSTAVLWEKRANQPANLNLLVVDNPSGLFLLLAQSINSSGEIVGLAVTSSGEPHGFLATPMNGEAGSEGATPAAQGLTQ